MDITESRTIPTDPGIYRIQAPTGKSYIGKSKNLRLRYQYHLRNGRTLRPTTSKLYRSMQKYGVDSHVFSVVELCDEASLLTREMTYIREYNSVDDGLNILHRSYELTTFAVSSYFKGKHRPDHANFMRELWRKDPSRFDRGNTFKEKLRVATTGLVTCRTTDGEIIKMPKLEFDARTDVVGITLGMQQPKLCKPVLCTTDNLRFESVALAAAHYGYSSGNIVSAIKMGKSLGKFKHGRDLNFVYC